MGLDEIVSGDITVPGRSIPAGRKVAMIRDVAVLCPPGLTVVPFMARGDGGTSLILTLPAPKEEATLNCGWI